MNKPNEQNLKPEETIEAMAWADLYAAAPADFVDKSGLSAFRIGQGCAIALPSLPEAVFNRTIGVREIQSLRKAYVGTQPAGSAAMFASDHSAWLGIDSAVPEHRKNGVQTALIRARIEKGRERGVSLFTVETGQPEAGRERDCPSFSNMLRAGFVQTETRLNFGPA
ncbi:hypothetical protein [Rhizobium sp. AG207R]|uniref:hypothetical protein n=1 Tax=Rhizobium sp. AG207R TaxID=2802287 RepID=UPI0022AC6AF6|nr:hypothetical protein [Rhizobium sp. AG207R]MCZ3380561.1 hypothetical protein [Rhizobium sp. AG207R]